MSINLLRDGSYDRKPWKNGGGFTEDVWVTPQGASHDDFDIRLSLATIDRDGPFSAFPRINRTITLVGGDPFVLDFGDGHQHRMEALQPFSFDSALTPSSRLILGSSHDFNVMTRAGKWHHKVQTVFGGSPTGIALVSPSILVVHVVSGSWGVEAGDQVMAYMRDSVIVTDVESIQLEASEGSAALVAIIQPVN